MKKNFFRLKGLTCVACTKLASNCISKLQGIYDVKIDLTGDSVVTADRVINKSEIKSALSGSGYEVI